MKNSLKYTLLFLLLVLVGIAAAGIYKFNFTDDDIYIENEHKKVKNIDGGDVSTENVDDVNLEIEAEAEEILQELIGYIDDAPDDDLVQSIDLSAAEFAGNGTEPFWGFTASGSNLILMEPSDTGPMNITAFGGILMTASGTSINMSGSGVSVDLTLAGCSDGMSDIAYDYVSTFTYGTTNYSGCANVD